MRHLTAALLFAACLSAAAPPATADPERPDGTPAGFRDLDRNRDNYISREEAAGDRALLKYFGAADANKDSRLDQNEYLRARNLADRQALSDTGISARVRAALVLERNVPSNAISIITYEGRVQLAGFLDSEEQAKRAIKVAAGVTGVKQVLNSLIIRDPVK